MALSEHEKWIRDNIGGTKIQVDSNELWESLQAHVPARKNKKGLYIFLIGLFLFSGITIAGYFVWTSNSMDLADLQISSNKQHENYADLSLKKENITKHTPQSNDDLPKENVQISTKELVDLNENVITNSNTINNNNNNNNNNSEAIIRASNYSTSAEISTSENKPLNPLKYPNQSILPSIKKSLNTPIDYASALNFKQQSDIEKDVPTALVRTFSLYSELNELKHLDALMLQVKMDSLRKPKIKMKRDPILFFQFNSGFNNHFVGINSSRSEFQQIHEIRKNATKNLPSYFSSFSLELKANDRWTFYAGLQYTHLVDRIRFNYTRTLKNNSSGIEQIFIDNQGLIEEIPGDVTFYTHSSISGKWHQNIHNYAWQFGFKTSLFDINRFEGQVGIGIDYSISTKTTGSYLSDELTIEKIETPFVYDRNKTQAHFSFHLNYALTKNTSLGLYSQFRTIYNGITLNENTLISEYLVGNIGLSCRYGIL